MPDEPYETKPCKHEDCDWCEGMEVNMDELKLGEKDPNLCQYGDCKEKRVLFSYGCPAHNHHPLKLEIKGGIMGVFDTYGDRQMKMGDPWFRQFNVGDSVKESAVDDGVYIDTDEDYKAIVIHNGIFIGEFNCYDHWGNEMTPRLNN